MDILAHRGFWRTIDERNSIDAMKAAFEHGFGIETDIRDYCGKLVISHNIANENSILAEDVFRLYNSLNAKGKLALNIKADGIQGLLRDCLNKYNIENYFVFDMSIPEQVVYQKDGFVFYSRQSDVEKQCVQYNEASGIWMDGFFDVDWITKEAIENHLKLNKNVCIVSPELHGKNHNDLWRTLKECEIYSNVRVSLCTDRPDEAKEYFYG